VDATVAAAARLDSAAAIARHRAVGMTDLLPPAALLMCLRDPLGRIVALTRQALDEENIKAQGWQVVAADDAEVDAFVHGESSQIQALRKTDIGLVRVLEDLIDVLISRGLLQFTDFPEAAQAKLLERRQSRTNLSHRLQPLLLNDEQNLF